MIPLWIEITTKLIPTADIIEDWIIKVFNHIKLRLLLKDGAKYNFYSYRDGHKIMIIFYDIVLSPEDTKKISQSLRWIALEQMMQKEMVEYIQCLGQERPEPNVEDVILLYIYNTERKTYYIDAYQDEELEKLWTSGPVIREKVKSFSPEDDLRVQQSIKY